MNKPAYIFICFLLLFASSYPAHSDTPYLQIYFDADLTEYYADCPPDPPGTVFDSVYVAAVGFDAFISAIEYRIDYTPHFVWLADVTTGLNIGQTTTGIATAWPYPQNAYSPLVVAKVMVMWVCQNCTPEFTHVPFCANGHSLTGYIRAVRWPDNQFIYATNKATCLCPTCCGDPCECPSSPIPVEESTWGSIKALYR
jgi:hypothetical protein